MFKNKPIVVPPVQVVDKNGKPITLPIEQIYTQDFMIGGNGFPMNDVSAIVKSQNVQEYQAMLSAIAQNRSKSPDNKGKSDAEILSDIWPKYMQTPSEIAMVSEHLTSLRLASLPADPAETKVEQNAVEPQPSAAAS